MGLIQGAPFTHRYSFSCSSCVIPPSTAAAIRSNSASVIDSGGIVKDVNLACVPEAVLGDYVLVHVGTAIGLIDAAEAARCLEQIRQL